MKIDENILNKTAYLARLELNKQEKKEFSDQLTDIINYVEKINELNTDDIKPADHIIDLNNVFRIDEAGKSLDPKEIKNIAPKFEDGHIVVPKIIEDSE